jgi:MATE family multidrug resistance protein
VSKNYTFEEQAVSQSMRNLFGLGGVFSWAFGSSANTIISNLIGQGRQNEIFKIINKLSIISTTWYGHLRTYPEYFSGLIP